MSDWPIYDSLSQAAGVGIPLAVLKTAKAAGCPAFRSNRVYTLELTIWLANQLQTGGDETKELLDLKTEQALETRERRKKLEMQNNETSKQLVPRTLCQEIVGAHGSQIRQCIMDQAQRIASQCNPEHPEVAAAALARDRDSLIFPAITAWVNAWEPTSNQDSEQHSGDEE